MRRPVKDQDANVLIEAEKQLSRLAEYFEEMLNRQTTGNPPQIHTANTDLPINCGPSRRAEIQLKHGKSPGPDEIPAEVLKMFSNC